MSVAKIQQALGKEFARRRVIFWYDPADDLIGWQQEFDALQLPGVEKLIVRNNEFGVKHRIAREQPQQKFLLYFRGQSQPADTENWLLDQLLAHGQPFSPDRPSLALIDAGLPLEFKPLTTRHLEFFRSADRVARLKEWLQADDAEPAVLAKMIAVVCRAEPGVESCLLALLGELASEKGDRWTQLVKYSLDQIWWRQVGAHFGYAAPTPSLLDLVLGIFRAVTPLGGASVLDARQSRVFLNRWKDSEAHRESFELLSAKADQLLNVSASLNQIKDHAPFLAHETYRRLDFKILSDLRDGLLSGSLAPPEVGKRADARSRLHWARHDAAILASYQALMVAAEFMERLPKLDLTIESFDAGLEKYASTWWRMDQLYRKFVQHTTESGQTALLSALEERIHGFYTNDFLGTLAARWQEWVDRSAAWSSTTVPSQREFVPRFVLPQLQEGRTVLVLISDALRYEAGQELAERLLREDRWLANVRTQLGVLPSFTQLGMAALLPHTTLGFEPKGQTVLADGVNTAGTEARAKILASRFGGEATALSAADFLALNSKTDGRELSRANRVIYVYQNVIDKVGDTRDTEHKTCAAVDEALDEAIRILKKGAAINISHFLVTADHGFVYQHNSLEDNDFIDAEEPETCLQFQRRFIIAQKLGTPDPRLRCFRAADLGLSGEFAFALPKGVQRLRLQGSGSRYVHGGASLQEVVVPVLEVRKERVSDVEPVDVDIVRAIQTITTGQVTITFVQSAASGEKRLPREVRAGFYSKTGLLISDVKAMRFDAASEDLRQRERRERFIFGREADAFNQQDVDLRLEEPVSGTNQFALYKEFTFKLQRQFESDFDDLH